MTSATNRLTLRTVLAAWRGITRAELRWTFVLACGLFVYSIFAFQFDTLGWLVFGFIVSQIKTFPLLLTFVVADRVTDRNPERRGTYTLAVVVGAAIGAPAAVAVASYVLHRLLFGRVGGGFQPGYALYFSLDLVLIGWAAVWVINDRRRAARARDLMYRAELERIEASKRTIESDLQAMQARVEPQFLFNTLAQVKRLYEQDPGLGERMLDELITYLRAAMPKMRDTSSTVGQEIELVRAYLAIVKVRLGDRLTYEIESPPALADMRMPPMLLLPLVDHAIVHGLAEPQGTGSIRIRAAIADGKIVLEIADSGDGFLPESEGDDIAGIRERLAALYSDDASLVLEHREAKATEAILELPFEALETHFDREAEMDQPREPETAY